MLSDERSKINDEFDNLVKTLNTKFANLKQPHLEKRDQIVAGSITKFPEEVTKFDASIPALKDIVDHIVKPKKDEDDSDEEEKPHVATDVSGLVGKAGVPDFWSVAAKNNQILMQTFREKDKEVLPFLSGLHVERIEEP
jgi:tRNA A37 threonylcarbamoyltransferase TsaD